MITGQTKLAAVIGDPVRHSQSPTLLNTAFQVAGLDWIYVAFPVAAGRGGQALDAMLTLGIEGLSVTMPHKEAVAEALRSRPDGRLTEAADELNAVNCVYRRDDELWGDSTDGDGLVLAVDHTFTGHQSAVPNGSYLDHKTVVVVGTGGAARSIVEAIGRTTSARLIVAGRNESKLAATASLARDATAVPLETLSDLEESTVLINATSVGMAGTSGADSSVVPSRAICPSHTVIDIVYQPRITPMLAAAEQAGAATLGGLPMLIYQAALAYKRWTGQRAPVDAMLAAF